MDGRLDIRQAYLLAYGLGIMISQKNEKGAAGLYVASPIWNEFMTKAYEIKVIITTLFLVMKKI